MALWIKICGVRDIETALYCAELGADAIGLVFAASPRQVTPALAREIAAALPAGVEKIGVFREASEGEMLVAAREAGLSAVQCHYGKAGSAPRGPAIEVIPALAADTVSDADLRLLGGRRYLLDSPAGPGSGRGWNYTPRPGRVILAGGLNPGNVARAIRSARPWGIDVSSGVEAARGAKDRSRIREFFAAARAAEKELA